MSAEVALGIAVTPGSVVADLAQVRELVDRTEADMAGLDELDLTDPVNVRWLKPARAEVNRLQKEIGAARRRAVAEYNAPIDAAVAECREQERRLRELSGRLAAKVNQVNQAWSSRRRDELQAEYEAVGGALEPLVPLERLWEHSWGLKGTSLQTCKDELAEKLVRLGTDWATVRESVPDAYLDVAERELFATLDLGAALKAWHQAETQDRKLSELRELVQPAPEPEPEPEAAPEPRFDWTIHIHAATRAEMEAVADELRRMGLTGRITQGGDAE